MCPKHGTRSLTPQDVREIVGALDDAKVAAILATGANAEQLEEAMAWAAGESDVMGDLERPLSGAVGRALRHSDDRRGVSRRSRLGGGHGSSAKEPEPAEERGR